MSCFRPVSVPAYEGTLKDGSKGYVMCFDRRLLLDRPRGTPVVTLKVPCGKCIGCKVNKAREWALRMSCENELHSQSCFLTLTYDDDHLPLGRTLVKSDLQKFLKRLRFRFPNQSIRYFACGEYGSNFNRPHYHLVLFGFTPPDLSCLPSSAGSRLFSSEIISSLWPFGFNSVGSVSFGSCLYVASYVVKKVLDDFNPDGRVPPFIVMSRRPGIGSDWLNFYKDDLSQGFLCQNSFKFSIPKYFKKRLAKIDEKMYSSICEQNINYAKLKESRALELTNFNDFISELPTDLSYADNPVVKKLYYQNSEIVFTSKLDFYRNDTL